MMSHENNLSWNRTLPGLDTRLDDGEDVYQEDLAADVFGNKVLPIDALKPLEIHEPLVEPSDTLARYFEQVLEEQHMATGCYILMPSLMSLGKFFDVPLSELRKAFWKLKRHGYDFVMPGDYGNISVWPSSYGRSHVS
jgi:hypothetical protein